GACRYFLSVIVERCCHLYAIPGVTWYPSAPKIVLVCTISMSDVMVVGGGAVGLLSALELSDRGCSVTVLDAPQARPPASWAGGGILSALFPWRYPDGVSALTRNALAAYQVLAQRFREHGLPELEVVECGLLMPGASDMDSAPAWAAAHEMSGVLTTAGEIV